MNKLWVLLLCVVVWGCSPAPIPSPTATRSSTPTPSATPSPSIAITCQPPPIAPRSALTCDAAVTAALSALGINGASMARIEFHYGPYCALTGGCPNDCPNGGYVVVHGAVAANDQWATVKADAQGTVVVAKPLGLWPPARLGLDWPTCQSNV